MKTLKVFFIPLVFLILLAFGSDNISANKETKQPEINEISIQLTKDKFDASILKRISTFMELNRCIMLQNDRWERINKRIDKNGNY